MSSDNIYTSALENSTTISSPMPSILFFFTITAIFGILTISFIYSKSTLDSIAEVKNNNVFNLIYIGILLIGSYFININISKTLCNTNEINWSNIFFITLLPWIIIFGLLYILLEIFPGWINPFSNTIGYLIVNALGATTNIINLFKQSKTTTDKPLKEALINIEKNYSKIINEFDIDLELFKSYIDQFRKEGIVNPKVATTAEALYRSEDVYKLYQHVIAKFFIGKLLWYILAGILIASISYNFILNIKCTKTLEEQKSEYEELYKKSTYVPVFGKKWKKISDKENKTDLSETSQFVDLIDKYAERFINNVDNEVEFTKRELRFVGIMNELPQNMCIQINGEYYIPNE
tara:strand:- start:585 stop:1631 length:1047 start_codon:yes stop_codon:yes gene_type:complete